VKLGRRREKPSIESRIRELKAEGMGILKIGRTVGVGTSVVQRVLNVDRASKMDSLPIGSCTVDELAT
jgi:hypothetical protein